MNLTQRHIILYLIYLLSVSWIAPAHTQAQVITLLGGEMSYRCTGKNYGGKIFEITLRLRRDCLTGAEFDGSAKVNIFVDKRDRCNYDVPSLIDLPLVTKETLSIGRKDCREFCDSLCVEEAVYRKTVTLPACPGGYTLAYQRCCRDADLDNIQDPGLQGGTWWVHISREAIEACNDSPEFPQWSDRYLCLDESHQMDLSAAESDGDSLVYRLYTPHLGADRNRPRPNLFTPPPYDPVEFVPPYSEQNMMGGQPFTIDPVTGVVTVTPGMAGQFLVGVAVDEWRDGKLLSTIRTDCQIDVCPSDPCVAPRDSFCVCLGETIQIGDSLEGFTPTPNCKYLWEPAEGLIFGESDEQCVNPQWTANETTRFTVIATNGNQSDTGYVYIEVIQGPSIELSDTFFVQCLDTDCIEIRADRIFQYQWDPAPAITIEGDSILFTFCPPEVNRYYYVVGLGEKSCIFADSFYVSSDLVVNLNPDTICPGDTSGYLLDERVDCWTYQWAPEESLIFLDSLVKAIPTKTTTYYVTVTNGTIEKTDSVTVVVNSPDTLSIGILDPPFLCDGRATLIGQTTGDPAISNFVWSLAPNFQPRESTEDTLHIQTSRDTLIVYLTAESEEGSPKFCGANTVNIILVDITPVVIPDYDPIDTCIADTTSVALRDAVTDTLIALVVWSTANPDNWVNPEDLTANPIRLRALPGQEQIVVYYKTTFENGCRVTDSVIVEITGEWNLDIDTTQSPCADTISFTVRQDTVLDHAVFTWYTIRLGDSIPQLVGTGESITLVTDSITEVFVAGEAFWCRDTARIKIPGKSKLQSIVVSATQVCQGDTVSVVLLPRTDDSLMTSWKTNGRIIDSTNTSLVVATLPGLDTIRIYFTSMSRVCPNLVCDSLIVIPLDTIKIPEPVWEKIPCTYQAWVSVDTLCFSDGEVQWTIPALGITSFAPIDTFEFPGQGSYQIILKAGPAKTSCLFPADTFLVIIPEFIQLFPHPDSIIYICADSLTGVDSLVELSVTTSIDSIDITWLNMDGEVLRTGPNLVIDPYAGDTLIYALSDPDACDCRDTVRFYIRVANCRPVLTCERDCFCPNQDFTGPTASLFCDGIVDTAVTYHWEPAEYIVSGQNTPNPVFNAPTSFQVKVTITTDKCGFFELQDSCKIEMLDTLSVNIEVVPDKVLEGLPMSLTAIPGTDDPYAYKWSTNESTQTIVVMPPVDSTFFSVTITDAKGCMASDTVGVRSLPCIVGVPNAFSPNGDLENDSFRVRSSCPLDYFELKILNRWGQEVYHTKDQEAGWDGTMNGKRLPPDVFAYCVIYSCPNEHEKKTLLGDVTLFR